MAYNKEVSMKKRNYIDESTVQRAEEFSRKINLGLPLDWADFIYLLDIHMEFMFSYKGKNYEITYFNDKLEFSIGADESGKAEEMIIFNSTEEFINNTRIAQKKIEEIIPDIVL